MKASGKWLARSESEETFIPLRLSGLHELISSNSYTSINSQVIGNNVSLKPSIETTMHAIISHKVVIHVHSVTALARLVFNNAEQKLRHLLAGVNYAFIPYSKPGESLTRAILLASKNNPNVLLLANHGLVIAGNTFTEVEELLTNIQDRLSIVSRDTKQPSVEKLKEICNGSDFILPTLPRTHYSALDSVAYLIAKKGTLYPDHIVFLGPSVLAIDEPHQNICLKDIITNDHRIILIEGIGALVHKDLCKGGEMMAQCLADVLLKIPENEGLRYLTPKEETELQNWDAEIYRLVINA